MEENADSIKKNNIGNEDTSKEIIVGPNDEKINSNKEIIKETKIEAKDLSQEKNNEKIATETSDQIKAKPKKEIPIEKKPFNEFVNEYLLPSLVKEFKERGFEILDISLKNTSRPIAGDKCWVIFCDIKDTCKFWLSFEQEDISSLKSISLCRSSQKPSVIESFLIDEKRITLKLIISRILQRLNGQKLIGVN